MPPSDEKRVLHYYLQRGRDAVLWKLDGLSEYDARRPIVPSGTNLLGLVKHLADVEFGYFGGVFGRPVERELPWDQPGSDNDPFWARADETREEIVGWYRSAATHSDATIESLDLSDVGLVPWWPDERSKPTLQTVLVHVIAETHRHAGHADILRESIDGAAGLSRQNGNMAPREEGTDAFRARIEEQARRAAAG